MRRRALAVGLAGLAGLAGCQPQGLSRIGFLAGLSGRGAATGVDGRNGAILAVEQVNAAVDARGRGLELVVQDNGDDPATARTAMENLLAAQVQAVVGPFASAVAIAVLPLAAQAGLLLVSPNATASVLAGKDDMLLMLSPGTRDTTRAYAQLLRDRGHRRMAVATATDPRDAVYAVAWRDEFRAAFQALGGAVTVAADFASDTATAYGEVVHRMLQERPDGLVFACGTVDAVRLAQQARRQAPGLPVAVADAAGGEALIALGGRAVEGVLVGQLHDRASTSARYLAFVAAYQERFGRGPGYHAAIAHDAVTVLVQAAVRGLAGESLKQSVLQHGPYDGLQQPIGFDRFGDTTRAPSFVVVQDGRFQPLR
ncbi:MAG: ABC transporter substrate-binding protein [Pseudorhodoferax sp.]